MAHPKEGAFMAHVVWLPSQNKASNGGEHIDAFRCRTVATGDVSRGLIVIQGRITSHHVCNPAGLVSHAIFSGLQLYCKYSVLQSQYYTSVLKNLFLSLQSQQ